MDKKWKALYTDSMDEKEVRTVGEYFSLKLMASFALGIMAGIVFAIPLVERGKFDTRFFAGVFNTDTVITPEKKVTIGTENKKEEYVVVTTENTLVVNGQQAGLITILSMVSLAQDGWVAIHEQAGDGGIGKILGARRFLEGKYFAISF